MSSLVKACGRLTLELETLQPRSRACLAFSSRSTIIVRATGTRQRHSLGQQYYQVSGEVFFPTPRNLPYFLTLHLRSTMVSVCC